MKRASECFDETIRVRTVDARSGHDMTPMAVLPGMLPRVGERIDVETGVVWSVQRVFWNGHPDTLEPTLYLLPMVQ